MSYKIKRSLNPIIKLFNIISFFSKRIFFLTFISILSLISSQLFLIIAYLLPIKILILLSLENIPDFLNIVFYDFHKDQIILILSFLVFILYVIHLSLEKFVQVLVSKCLKILSKGNSNLENDTFSKKFIEIFFKLIATLLLVFLLFCMLFYIFHMVAIALLFCLLIIIIIISSGKIEKNKITKISHISFFIGFIVVFIYEVVYLLYYNTEKVSIITILVSIVIVRYIFLRGVFIVSKLLVLHRDLNVFYKKFKR